jgi:hypothetical protein
MIKVFQYFEPPIPGVYRKCMNYLRHQVPKDWIYEFYTQKLTYKNNGDIRTRSNYFRLEKIRGNPWGWWFDSDILPMARLDLIPLPGENICVSGEVMESIIFGNGAIEEINDVFSGQTGFNSIGELPAILSKKIYPRFQTNYFLHLHLGCMIESGRRDNQFCKITDDCENFVSINGFDAEILNSF